MIEVKILDADKKGLFIDILREGEPGMSYALEYDEVEPLLIALEDYLEANETVK